MSGCNVFRVLVSFLNDLFIYDLDCSEGHQDDESSDYDLESDDEIEQRKFSIQKLKSKAIPICRKRKELYSYMNESSGNNTDNTITNLTDESKREKMLETVSGDNSKTFSPGSLSFYQRLIPWSMTIWDIQVS